MRATPTRWNRLAAVVAVAAAAMAPSAALGAESGTEARLREALRTVTVQLRRLEDERAQWQLTDAAQKKELDALKLKLAAGAAEVPRSKGAERCAAQLKQCQAKQSELDATSSKLEEALSHCEAASGDAAIAAKAQDEASMARAKDVAARVGALTERAKGCETKNARMFAVAKEVLDRLWRSGAGEPVLGLKRVEVENYAQEAEDRLLESQVKP